MIRVATNSATETAITDQMGTAQKLFDDSVDKPQYTPKEIAAIYPDLNKDAQRQALFRVANASKTERGKHIVNVLKFVNMIRPADDYEGCWDIFCRITYPDATPKERREYFVDLMILWCFPVNPRIREAMARQLELSAQDGFDYEASIHRNYETLTPEFLEKEGKRLIARYSELNAGEKNVKVEDELESIDFALSAIEQIYLIWDEDYYALWREVKQEAGYDTDSAAAYHILELLKTYHK